MQLRKYHSSSLLALAVASALIMGLASSALSQNASRADSGSRSATNGACARTLANGARSNALGDSLYSAENDSAMARMLLAMATKSTGDIDRDFVTMMIPHHQGAIDMSVAFLRYGCNEQLKRLAQEIIVTQQQEIVTMRRAVDESQATPDQPPTHPVLQRPSGGETTTARKEPNL